MKFFLDTANINEIREAAALGILDGVTTNPSLIAKEGKGKTFKETILEICSVVDGPVNADTDAGAMCKEGREYASWHKNIVVKLPTTRDGLKACKCLVEDGIRTNLTLCFSVQPGVAGGQSRRQLREPVSGAVGRYRPRRHGPGQADPPDLSQLRLQDAGAGGVAAAPTARDRRGAGRCRRGYRPLQGARSDVQPPTHRQGAGYVPEGLGEVEEVKIGRLGHRVI